MVMTRIITTTTISVIPMGEKLLMALIKMNLPKIRQNVRVKKIWIETTG